MSEPWTWVEPFAGAAACALRLVGGRDVAPPVAWMGGKRRYARAILDAMGVPDEPPSRVLLADAGPWGWVWPLLLVPTSAAIVAKILRSWSREHPRDLWQRLASKPPASSVYYRAAQWLWLQARSASGVPIWWDGWRAAEGTRWEAPNGRGTTSRPGFNTGQAARDRGEDLRWPGHQAQREAWKASDGRGDPRPAGQRTDRWSKGAAQGRSQDATRGQRGAWRASNGAGAEVVAGQKTIGSWRFDRRPGDVAPDRLAGPSGETAGRTGGMVDPCTIASRIEAIAAAFVGVDVTVHHGDARAVRAPRRRSGGLFVYLDPPYQGATGYGWTLIRRLVLALARRWERAGAVVAVSEAVPLELVGWHHVDLTRPGGKPEHLTLSRLPALLPVRQGDLFDMHAPAASPEPAGSGGG